MRQDFPNLTRTPQIEYHHGITCSGYSDDRGMKYHQSVSTRSSVWYLDRVILVMAVSLGLFGLVAWAILPPSQAPLGMSLGISAASWLVTLVLGLVLRPFPTKLTGKVDADEMRNAVARKMSIAWLGTTWPALILFVLAFLLHLPRAFVLLGMIADGVTMFLLLHSTDQRLEQFAETWCGDQYDPANPEIDKFLHDTPPASLS